MAWLGAAALLVSAGACGGRSDLGVGGPRSETGGFGGDLFGTGGTGTGGFTGCTGLGCGFDAGVAGSFGTGGNVGTGGFGTGGFGAGGTGGFGTGGFGAGGTGGFGTGGFGAGGTGGFGTGGSGAGGTGGFGAGGTGGFGAGGTGGFGTGGFGGGTGGVSGTGGTGSGGTGGIVQCVDCITQSCPQVQQCLADTTCRQGVECTLTQCLSGGGFDVQCAISCFNGDFNAAYQAFQAVQCVYTQCGSNCIGGISAAGGSGGAIDAGVGLGGSGPIDAGIGTAPAPGG